MITEPTDVELDSIEKTADAGFGACEETTLDMVRMIRRLRKIEAAAKSIHADLCFNADTRQRGIFTMIETVRVNALRDALEAQP